MSLEAHSSAQAAVEGAAAIEASLQRVDLASQARHLSVSFVTASLSDRAGGLAVSVPATVNALGRLGFDIRVFGLRDAEFDSRCLPYERAKIVAVEAWPIPALHPAPALDSALSEEPADVLHLQGLWLYPSIATLRWRARTRRPVIISPHGMLDPWALQNSAWKKQLALALFERRNLEGAACIHALNDCELSAIRALGIRTPVAVIPNGVDPPQGPDLAARPVCLAGEERRVLLFLGRIHPKKGLSETLAAWARVRRQHPTLFQDWLLIIAGWDDGGHVAVLKRQVAKMELTGSVRFVGPVFGSEKARLLARADAFILASHSEGLPMAVLEAWSYGIPVLMTRACNLPSGFDAGAAVEITTDPQEMAAIVANSLADPDLARFGASGRILVAESFSWERVGNDLAAVYQWATGRGPQPDCVDLA